jgi:hypothetical protein
MLVAIYPIIICGVHSFLRLCILPDRFFIFYAGLAKKDSEKFRVYDSLTTITSLFAGMLILTSHKIIELLVIII